MSVEVGEWSTLSADAISVEAIRSLYQPASHFRVSRNGFDAGVSFPGTRRAGRTYVLSGRCVEATASWRAELGPGQFVDFPAGAYTFTVLGSEPVRFVSVWEIPEQYRQRDKG